MKDAVAIAEVKDGIYPIQDNYHECVLRDMDDCQYA